MPDITLVADCPHCFIKHAHFSYSSGIKYDNRCYHLSFICSRCKKMIIADVYDSPIYRNTRNLLQSKSVHLIFNQIVDDFWVKTIYPEYPKQKVLAHVPERMAKYFREAQEHLRNEYYDTCMVVCRKILEMTTVGLLEARQAKEGTINISKTALVKSPLWQKIELLCEYKIITLSMSKWAAIVCDESAAHADGECSESEAKELFDFTEMFLIYVYTLPYLILEKQKLRQFNSF